MTAAEQPARGEWRDGWFVVPYQVIFRDLDFFGHVNNAVYLTYFEWARALYWFEVTGTHGPESIGFIVARAECDYKEPIGMEPIEIRVRVAVMRRTSFDFVYEIWKSRGEVLAASGKVVVVLYDWESRSKTAITDELRRTIESHGGPRSDPSRSRTGAVP